VVIATRGSVNARRAALCASETMPARMSCTGHKYADGLFSRLRIYGVMPLQLGLDDTNNLLQHRRMSVVQALTTRQLPGPLYRIQSGALGRRTRCQNHNVTEHGLPSGGVISILQVFSP